MLQDENVWLNSNAIANLFNVDRSVITKHINNIYNEEELEEDLTSSKRRKSHSKEKYFLL